MNGLEKLILESNKEKVSQVPQDDPKPKSLGLLGILSNPNIVQAFNENNLDRVKSIDNSRYNTGIVPGNNPNDVRAANQGFFGEFANSFLQTGANILGSGATAVIDTATWIPNIVAKLSDSEKRFGEDLANYVNKINKDFNQEIVPVYNNSETKDVSEWFFENVPSLGTAVGLLLPVLGVVKLLGAVARATKGYNLYAKMLAKTAGIQEGSQAANALLGGIETLTAASLSRQAESMMEARDAGESAYQRAIQEGADEETAQKVKKEAAQKTYNDNWKLLALDILQFGVAFKSYKRLSIARNEAERKLLKATRPQILKNLAFQMGSESVEEQIQLVTSKEAERDALIRNKLIKDDYSRLPERLLNYAFGEYSDEFWTSSFFGALGGGVFEGIAAKSESNNKNKERIKYNTEKAEFEKKAAVLLKDEQKFKESDNITLDGLSLNAIINGRAEDIENMYSAVIDTQKQNTNQEEAKENIQKAQDALTRLKEYRQLYDSLATKDPINAGQLIVNRSFAKILDSRIELFTNEANNIINNISTNSGLDFSFVKLLENRIELAATIASNNSENISESVFNNKLAYLKELNTQLEDAILTNNNISKEDLNKKLSTINSSLLADKIFNKVQSTMRRETLEEDFNKLQTVEGRNLYLKDYLKAKENFKEEKVKELITKLDNAESDEQIVALEAEAKSLGKEKEYNLAKERLVNKKAKESETIDKNNIKESLEKRWDNNIVLKLDEIKKFKQIANQTGGLIKGLPFDEEHIAKLYASTPAFKKKIDEYIAQNSQPEVNNENKDKVVVESKNTTQTSTLQKDSSFDNLWVSPAYQYEYNKETGEFITDEKGNLKSNESTATKIVNWKEVNSGSIPIGATINYEINYGNKNNWDNFVKQNENNADKFLVELVHYRGLERIVVGVLPAVRNIGTVEEQQNLKKLREKLHKELVVNSNKIGIKQSKLTTKLTKYYRGQIHNTPTSNFIKGIFENPIFGVMVNINNEITIDTNGDNRIKNNLYQTESYSPNELGRIYVYYKHPALNQYIPIQLFTNTLGSNEELYKIVRNKLADLTPQNLEQTKNTLSKILYLRNIKLDNNVISLTLSSGDIVKIDQNNIYSKNEDLEKLLLQVDNKRINKTNYNQELIDNNVLSTNVNPNEILHSVNFAIEPYTENVKVSEPKVTIKVEEKSEQKEDITLSTLKVRSKIPGIGTTNIDVIGEPKYSSVDEKEFGETINEKDVRKWFAENLPQFQPEIIDHLIEINRKGGGKAWGVFKDKAITLYKAAPRGTEHHEAFHAVFDLFLTKEQKEQILNEASEKYGIPRSYDKENNQGKYSAINYRLKALDILQSQKGVSELFESNPELANQVYEALGFKQPITQDNKSYYRGQIEKPTIDKDGNLVLFGREDELYKKAGLKSKGVSMTDDLQSAIEYGNGQLEVAQNLASETYDANRELERLSENGYYLIQIPKNISNEIVKEAGEVKVIGDKIVIPKGQYKIEQVADGVEQITPQQKQQAQRLYSQYLDTIFPDSKVKDIVYHGSDAKFEKFSKDFAREDRPYFYFSFHEEANMYKESREGSYIYPVILNVNNYATGYTPDELEVSTVNDLIKQGFDAVAGRGWTTREEIAVFEPEQIHILGSKQDIEGFKHWLELTLTENFKNDIIRFKALDSNVYNTNDLKLQEILADELINYIQQNGNDNSLGYYISRFFKNLWNTIKSLFTDNISKNNLFERINTGFYKNYKIVGDNTTKYSAVGLTPFQQLDGVKSINYKFFETIDKYKKPNESYLDYLKSQKDISNKLLQLYGEVYNGLVDEINKALSKNDLKLATVLNNLAEQFLSTENNTITAGPIYQLAVRDLINYGINININNKVVTIDEAERLTPEELSDPELEIVDEDGSRNPQLYAKSVEQNPKDKLRSEVKTLLKTSKSYIYENGEFKQRANSLGLNAFAEFDELVNYLHQHISSNLDLYTFEEMLSKLQDLETVNPDLHDIVTKLKTNENLRAQFFSDFSLGYYPTYLMDKQVAKQEDGTSNTTYRLYEANRKGIYQLLIDDWNNNLVTQGKNRILNSDNTINKELAKKYYDEYINIVKKIISQKEITEQDSINLSNTLSNFGITISPKSFINEFKEVTLFRQKISPLENLLTLLNNNKESIKVILNSIVQGNNPYQGDTSETSSIRSVSQKIAKNEVSLHQDLILNVENKSEYAYAFPTFLHKKLGELQFKEKREQYLNNWWFSANKFLEVLNQEENENILKQFRPKLINGFKNEYNVGTKFFDLTEKELAVLDLNLYINNGNAISYYRMPLLSDSAQSVILPMKKFNKSEIIDGLYKISLAEKQRMDVISNTTINIKNYTNNGQIYSIVTDFNDNRDAINDEEKAKQIIEKWLENKFKESKEWYSKEKLLNDKQDIASGIISTGKGKFIESYNTKLEEFFYNKLFANVNLMELTSVDFSFYKKDKNTDFSYSDFIKRNGQIWKATRMMDINASWNGYKVRENYNVIYIKDLEGSAKKAFIENIKKELKRQNYSKSEIDAVVSEYNSGDINSTDSQTFISLDRMKEILIGFGEWSQEKETAFKRIKEGVTDNVPANILFQVEKPFYFNHHTLSNIILPTQIKNSEAMLSEQYVGNSRELQAVWKLLKSGKVDSVIFTSAIKAGEYNAITIEELINGVEPQIHKFSNKYYGRQNEIPSKHIDKEILFGSQVKVLITGDIPSNATFFDGKLNKNEVYTLYQELLAKNIRDSYNEVAAIYNDVNKLSKELIRQVDNLGLGQDFKDALKVNADGKFELPLYDPVFGQKFQSILTSIIRNNITKQKINGASLVNMSDFGYSNELNIVVENGIKYYEIYLPAWTKENFPRNSKGEVELDKLPDNMKDLFGYRIPTEHKYSMKRFRVKGFTPDFMGGVVVLPGIITKIAGEDFDKDTTYIMLPNTAIENSSGVVQKLEYDQEKLFGEIKEGKLDYIESLTKEQADNAIQDIIKEIWSNPLMSSQIIEPSSFQTLKDLKEEINTKLGNNVKDSNPVIPTNEYNFFKIITNGNNLIGVAANHLVNHAFAQYSDLKLVDSIDFNNKKATDLNKIYDLNDKKLISKNLAEFVAAFVDNTKDPVATDLNINNFTIDTILTIVRLGYDLKTAIYFVNQPVIREYTKRYFEKGATLTAEKESFTFIESRLIYKSGNNSVKGKYQFSDSQLLKNIKPNTGESTKEEYSEQLEILNTFKKYKEQADILSKVVRSSKNYVNGIDKTMGGSTSKEKLRQEVLESKKLENVDSLFNVKLIKASDEYGVDKPLKLLGNYLPFNSARFKDLINKATDIKGEELTADEVNYINRQFVAFYMSGFNAYDINNASKYINDFPLYFNKIKSNPKFSEFKIIKYLRYAGINENNKVPRIELISSASISATQKEEIKISLKAMLESKDSEIKQLAEFLVAYSFYTTKFNFTYSGYSQLIPNEYIQKLKDSDDNFYRDYLYKLQDSTYEDSLMENDVFLSQFYAHTTTKYPRLIKLIEDKQISNRSKQYQNYIPSIVFNKKARKTLGLTDKNRFIKIGDNIYQYNGFTVDGSMIFNILERRGYESNIFEYDKVYNTPSVLAVNKLPNFPADLYFQPEKNQSEQGQLMMQLIQENNQKLVEKQNEDLNKVLYGWATSLGIKIEQVEDLKNRLGVDAKGVADVFNNLILISKKKADVTTLPEEVGHFAEAYMRGDVLHTRLMEIIENTTTFKEVKEQYSEQYNNDKELLKREAVGKLIGQAVVRRYPEVRKANNNIVLQFLEGLWNKFVSIFKKTDEYAFQKEVNDIINSIADQILSGDTTNFKRPTQIKIGETFYQLPDNAKLENAKKILIESINNINSKIKIYEKVSQTASAEYVASREKILENLIEELNKKNYEKGLLTYVTNASEEIASVAERYSKINPESLENNEQRLEVINTLKHAQDYVEGFKDILKEIDSANIFEGDTARDIALLNNTISKLESDYLAKLRKILTPILQEFNSNSNFNVEKTLNELDKDLNISKTWLDAMAESRNDLLEILDIITKNSKEQWRQKLIDLSKRLLVAQKELERANVGSSSFVAERDKDGKITGYIVREYNYFDYFKEKERFFKENPRPERSNFTNPDDFIKADKEWKNKTRKWFQENTKKRSTEERKAYIEKKKQYFINVYGEKIGLKKYNDWIVKNTFRRNVINEYGDSEVVIEDRNELVLPADKYLSEQYKDIQSNEARKKYYEEIKNILEEIDSILPERFKLNGKLPQVRKDFYERAFQQDANGKTLKPIKQILKDGKTTITEQFVKNENDTDYGLTNDNGEAINLIPVYFTKRLDDMSNLSLDITSSVAMFAGSAYDFNALTKVVNILETTKDVISNTKVLTGKKNYITKISDLYAEINGQKVPYRNQTKIGKDSLIHKRLEEYLSMIFYGQMKKEEFIGKVNVGKTLDALNKYTSLNSIALNLYSGISNITFGTSMIRIESISNEFFGSKEDTKANLIYSSEMAKGGISNIGQRLSQSKLELWDEKMNVLQDYGRELKHLEANKNTVFARMFKISSLYFINHIGEHYMQNRTSLALSQRIKLKDKEGNIITLWDAFDVKDNKLVIKEGLTKVGYAVDEFKDKTKAEKFAAKKKGIVEQYKDGYIVKWTRYSDLFKKEEDGMPLEERDIFRFINRQNFLNKRLHGIYNDIDRAVIQKYALGRIATLFRKYIKPGWNRRWELGAYSQEGEIFTEGNYTTVFRLAKELVKDMKKVGFLAAINQKELTDYERANLYRTMSELSYMIAIAILASAAVGWSDDDENNYMKALTAYQLNRQFTEMAFYWNPQEGLKILKSPAAAVTPITNTFKLLQFWNWLDENERGKYKGYNELEEGLLKTLPFVGTKFNLDDPREQLRFYTAKH